MQKFLFVPNLSDQAVPQHAAEIIRGLQQKGQQIKVLLLDRFATNQKNMLRTHVTKGDVFLEEKDLDAQKMQQLKGWADILFLAPVGRHILSDIAELMVSDAKTKFAKLLQEFDKPRIIGMREEQELMKASRAYNYLQSQGFQFFDFMVKEQEKAKATNIKTLPLQEQEQQPDVVTPKKNIQKKQPADDDAQPHLIGYETPINNQKKDYQGKRILMTIGSTFEVIDPAFGLTGHMDVKFLKEVARNFIARGAKLIVVGNNITADEIEGAEQLITVRTARELRDAIFYMFDSVDLFFHSMLVVPFRTQSYPLELLEHKVASDQKEYNLTFVRNPNILQQIQKIREHQKIIAFNVATANLLKDSYQKIKQYDLDMVLTTTPLVLHSEQLQALIVTKGGEHISLQQGDNMQKTCNALGDLCLKIW